MHRYPHLYLSQPLLQDINNMFTMDIIQGREIGSGSILETCLHLQILMVHPMALQFLVDQEDR